MYTPHMPTSYRTRFWTQYSFQLIFTSSRHARHFQDGIIMHALPVYLYSIMLSCRRPYTAFTNIMNLQGSGSTRSMAMIKQESRSARSNGNLHVQDPRSTGSSSNFLPVIQNQWYPVAVLLPIIQYPQDIVLVLPGQDPGSLGFLGELKYKSQDVRTRTLGS